MKRILTLLFLILLAFPAYSFLKSSGQQIVDSTGTPVLLRGYGLGGWLVPEGYMLHFPGFGSPTAIRNMIEDLIGPQNTAQFYAAYEANYVTESDIEAIAGWGCNSIRLPFHYRTLYDTGSGTFREEGFAVVDSLLEWCRRNELYLILDMHCAPGGQNGGNISDSDGEARLWTEPQLYQPLTILIWQEIAERYKDEPQIGGYDLLNEPVLPDGYSAQVLRDFYIELTEAIRQIDTNHIVFIEGNWYATDFTLLTPPWDSNMAYSFHKYWSTPDLGSIQGYLSMRSQHNVPLWMGESGENSNPWFYSAIQLFESQGIGWCWWAHKKLGTTTSPFSAVLPANYQTLLNYWNGQGGQPSVTFATNALLQMAEALKIDQCEVRQGVTRALFDPDFGTQAEPFASHAIPGAIDAVHYDFGSNGVGYTDSDYQNTSGSGGSAWNSGYEYRNDGVDIERSQDPLGNAYNVGWTAPGERLNYTVEVSPGGIYRFQMRVASPNGEGKIVLLVDNQQVSDIVTPPATGDWQNWVTMIINDVPIPAGTHQFSLYFIQGGFNLNRMTFQLVATGIDDADDALPEGYRLAQNYPNPFNPETNFGIRIADFGMVTLAVYDLQGRLVRTLLNAPRAAGAYEINWDGRNDAGQQLSSGTYFYRLTVSDMKSGRVQFRDTKKMVMLQ